MANSQFNNQSNESKDDAMPIYFPPGVAKIVTTLLSGNIDTHFAGDKDTKPFTADERQRFRLFEKPMTTLIERPLHTDPDALKIGNWILSGEEKNVDEALTLLTTKLQQNPSYLEYAVIATDPLKRQVKGTLLQIAVMAGDVDLKADIREEKRRGLVERIVKVGNLSNEETALQLQVITSQEAQEANKKRNQRVFDAVKKFGEGLIRIANESKVDTGNYKNFTELQTLCKTVIDELEKALIPDLKEVITLGFIFDTSILYQAAKWFEDNIDRFDGKINLKSRVFWTNGFGKLQTKLSPRDAQMAYLGAGRLIEGVGRNREFKTVPGRTLNDEYGSYFFNADSRLGRDYYLGYYGHYASTLHSGGVENAWSSRGLEDLCRTKTAAIANLCGTQLVREQVVGAGRR